VGVLCSVIKALTFKYVGERDGGGGLDGDSGVQYGRKRKKTLEKAA